MPGNLVARVRSASSPAARTVVSAAMVLTALVGCGSGSDDGDQTPVPVVDQIDQALDSVSERYPETPKLFEVSANLVDVRVVVAEDWADGVGAAASYSFRDGELSEPTALGEGQGSVFAPSAVDFDASKLFDRVRTELPGSLVTDFAVTGGPDGAVIYDATMRSESGGQLRVRLAGDGAVLEVMAE